MSGRAWFAAAMLALFATLNSEAGHKNLAALFIAAEFLVIGLAPGRAK